jgi:hypothetical protein
MSSASPYDSSTTDEAHSGVPLEGGLVQTTAPDRALDAGSTAAEEAKRMASTATEETKQVVATAAEGAKHVAREAGSQAREVVQEASTQIRNLAEQGQAQLRIQAEQQAQRASANLRTLAEQARALAEGRVDEAGPLADQIRRVAWGLSDAANGLDRRGFDGLIADVRSFARRRPAAFIGLTALAGFAVSRIGRNLSGPQSGRNDAGKSSVSAGRSGADMSALPNAERHAQSYADGEPLGHGVVGDRITAEDIVLIEDITPQSYGNNPGGETRRP